VGRDATRAGRRGTVPSRGPAGERRPRTWGGPSMHSEEEAFRGTLRARSVDGDPHTVIVMRRGLGRNARVWLTLNGAWKTTIQMTDPEASRLVELLTEAQMRRRE